MHQKHGTIVLLSFLGARVYLIYLKQRKLIKGGILILGTITTELKENSKGMY